MRTLHTDINAETPSGAEFIITQSPFTPNSNVQPEDLIDFDERTSPDYDSSISHASRARISRDRLLNWPMVYILANDEEAYVGQTTSVVRRMGQHGANPEKSAFNTVNVIYNEEFNASVVTDYEHRLIDYMHGDGRYNLTNKNNGIADSDYFSKTRYTEMFEALWEDLRAHDLANHTLQEIEESDIFKYSPYKQLNVEQKLALDEIVTAINAGLGETPAIVVEGMPGTGKTVLAVYLLKLLKDNESTRHLNIKLVEPVTSLRKTLKRALSTVSGLSKDDVIAPSDVTKPACGYIPDKQGAIDILLVDEAHKLKRRVNLSQYGPYDQTNVTLGLAKEATQMDWALNQSKLAIFFYDPLQSVGPSCLTPEGIAQALGPALKNPIRLSTQMRVAGGEVYINYIRDILRGLNPRPQAFPGYEFILHNDFNDFIESFEEHLKTNELTRIVAGYAWPWLTKSGRRPKNGEKPATSDIDIDGVCLRWNRTADDWVGLGLGDESAAHEVGCIHSIQGYDLSYAYVIVGSDLAFDPSSGDYIAVRTNYYDINGKRTASDEELDAYVRNIYYVLLTRGIFGTHVYVADPKLRKRLRAYFCD